MRYILHIIFITMIMMAVPNTHAESKPPLGSKNIESGIIKHINNKNRVIIVGNKHYKLDFGFKIHNAEKSRFAGIKYLRKGELIDFRVKRIKKSKLPIITDVWIIVI